VESAALEVEFLTGNQLERKWKPMRSIRQLADDLSVSHTTIRTAILELETELGHPIGKSGGRGRPTELSDRECELIAGKFYKPAFIQDSRPQAVSGLAVRQSEQAIEVYQTEKLHLTVTDSTAQLTQAVQSLDATLQQWMSNGQTLDTALLQDSAMKGTALGTQMAIAKVGNAVKSAQAVELELAKKLGLVQEAVPE
jgi:DNA-binding transcriptional MocR family regulator